MLNKISLYKNIKLFDIITQLFFAFDIICNKLTNTAYLKY